MGASLERQLRPPIVMAHRMVDVAFFINTGLQAGDVEAVTRVAVLTAYQANTGLKSDVNQTGPGAEWGCLGKVRTEAKTRLSSRKKSLQLGPTSPW